MKIFNLIENLQTEMTLTKLTVFRSFILTIVIKQQATTIELIQLLKELGKKQKNNACMKRLMKSQED